MANTRPVCIEVTVFGTYHMKDDKNLRNIQLMQILKQQGGINASVIPGTYLFNVLPGPDGDVVSLERA